MVLRCVGSRVSSRMIISKRDNHGFAVLSRKESSLPSLREPVSSPRLRPTSTHPRSSTSSLLLKRGRELCGFAFTHTKSKGDPWHNLIPWPRDKAGIFVFGQNHRSLASRVAAHLEKPIPPPSTTGSGAMIRHCSTKADNTYPNGFLRG